MATLTTTSTIAAWDQLADNISAVSDINLQPVEDALDFSVIEPDWNEGELSPAGDRFEITVQSAGPDVMDVHLVLTGSGFSQNFQGGLDTEDEDFILNSLDIQTFPALSVVPESRVQLTGNIVISGGELQSSTLSSISFSSANQHSVTLNGNIQYDGVNLIGNGVTLTMVLDGDTSGVAGHAPAPMTLTATVNINANSNENDADDFVYLRNVTINDPTRGASLQLSDINIELGQLENVEDLAGMMAVAGRGLNDQATSSGNFVLPVGFERLTLSGSGNVSGDGNALANTITGNTGANLLRGMAGNDSIVGGSGNDTLIGGLGADNLTGGAGADRFKFVTRNDGKDVVTDFNAAQGDKLVFLKSNFGNLANGQLVADRLRVNANGYALDANDRFAFSTNTRTLWFDSNGNAAGGRVAIAQLNVNTITAANILISAT